MPLLPTSAFFQNRQPSKARAISPESKTLWVTKTLDLVPCQRKDTLQTALVSFGHCLYPTQTSRDTLFCLLLHST